MKNKAMVKKGPGLICCGFAYFGCNFKTVHENPIMINSKSFITLLQGKIGLPIPANNRRIQKFNHVYNVKFLQNVADLTLDAKYSTIMI